MNDRARDKNWVLVQTFASNTPWQSYVAGYHQNLCCIRSMPVSHASFPRFRAAAWSFSAGSSIRKEAAALNALPVGELLHPSFPPLLAPGFPNGRSWLPPPRSDATFFSSSPFAGSLPFYVSASCVGALGGQARFPSSLPLFFSNASVSIRIGGGGSARLPWLLQPPASLSCSLGSAADADLRSSFKGNSDDHASFLPLLLMLVMMKAASDASIDDDDGQAGRRGGGQAAAAAAATPATHEPGWRAASHICRSLKAGKSCGRRAWRKGERGK